MNKLGIKKFNDVNWEMNQICRDFELFDDIEIDKKDMKDVIENNLNAKRVRVVLEDGLLEMFIDGKKVKDRDKFQVNFDGKKVFEKENIDFEYEYDEDD